MSISKKTWHISTAPPLGLAYIASSLIQAGFSIKVIDSLGEKLSQYGKTSRENIYYRGLSIEEIVSRIPHSAELLLISCMFSLDWNHTKDILKAIKEEFPKLTILAGGENASNIPEYILNDSKDIDYICRGEGEEFVVDFCKVFFNKEDLSKLPGLAYRNNDQVIANPKRTRIRTIDDIPWPAWDYFPIENYLDSGATFGIGRGRTISMLASRGCPYECTFCSAPGMWGKNYYSRDPKDIVREMITYKEKYQIDRIEFHDLTIFVGKNWVIDFCKEIIRNNLDIEWSVTIGTRSEGLTKEAIRLLVQSHCKYITFAPESGSDSILDAIKKKLSVEKIYETMKLASKEGLTTKINMIIGFPNETRADLIRTVLFIWKCAYIGVKDIGMAIFYVYPGSKEFNDFVKEKKIILNDQFFDNLFNWELFKSKKNYCRHVSDIELSFYKVFGMLSFYFLTYLFHPLRILKTLKDFPRGLYNTRFEKYLFGLIKKKPNDFSIRQLKIKSE